MIEWIQSIPCPLIKRLLGPGCRVFSHSICIEKCHVRLEIESMSKIHHSYKERNQPKLITCWSERNKGAKIDEGLKHQQGMEMHVCDSPGWIKTNGQGTCLTFLHSVFYVLHQIHNVCLYLRYKGLKHKQGMVMYVCAGPGWIKTNGQDTCLTFLCFISFTNSQCVSLYI